MKNKSLILLSVFLLYCCFCVGGQMLITADSVIYKDGIAISRDSLRRFYYDRAMFVVSNIENTYISGRRGMSDEEWEERMQIVKRKINTGYLQFVYACRYMGLLMHDAHFAFPQAGQFSRSKFINETDIIFPLWVKTWTDGSVYNVKDYTGQIPVNACILSVNGHSAKEMALINRMICPGEEKNAMAMMNAKYESAPQSWPNFANFLYSERIRPPYKVVYVPAGSTRVDTIVLNGLTRGEIFKQYKRSGDKRRLNGFLSSPKIKPIVYTNCGDSIGVLSINSFWGRNLVELLLFKKDQRYKRKLCRAMRNIERDGIKHLVIDVSYNGGGMTENLYHTLDYLTDKPVERNQIYYVDDRNREVLKKNILLSSEISKSDQDSLIRYINNVKVGSTFATDTVCKLSYIPKSPRYKFKGKVYIVTSNLTYSTGQMFARFCQKLDIGPVAGQHSGGYTEITGGNAIRMTLPNMGWANLSVPYSAVRICEEDDPYDYPPVDIPIDVVFEEWLHADDHRFDKENHTLKRLISMIQAGKI